MKSPSQSLRPTTMARPAHRVRTARTVAAALLFALMASLLTACLGDESDNYLYLTSISNNGYLDADGEQLSISVYTNVELTITTSQSWIYLVSTSSDSDGNDYYAFTVEANTSTSQRTATIIFSGEDLVASVGVTQYAAGEGDEDEE